MVFRSVVYNRSSWSGLRLHVSRRHFSSSFVGREPLRSSPDMADPTLSWGSDPLQLPKHYEHGITYFGEYPRFRYGICDYAADRLVVREISMLKLMDAITDKTNWHLKIHDETIVQKWREESQANPNDLISDKAFAWCLRELRDRAKSYERDRFVRTIQSFSSCAKSDEIIPTALGDDLRRALRPLLQVHDDLKDWHPKSKSQVLNIVHPSLYPLVGDRSWILTDRRVDRDTCFESIGQGTLVKSPEKKSIGRRCPKVSEHALFSNRFQWLPSDIQFVGDGTEVKITSYINNLHPKQHRDLYSIIEKFIAKSVPLWDSVLLRGWDPSSGLRIEIKGTECEPAEEPSWFMKVYEDEEDLTHVAEQVRQYIAQPDNPLYANRMEPRYSDPLPQDPKEWNADDVYQTVREVYERTRTIVHPEPDIETYEQWKSKDSVVHLEEEFQEKGLQVIVKLSSIELTPENPDYSGGSWHLEGMLNEGIVATAIYYCDVDNVTESRISFSQENGADQIYWGVKYEQSDHDPIAITFGIEDIIQGPAEQEIGSIATRQGRLIAFSNTLRHKVQPFTLVDKGKPGHRRYLVLWLVDPHHRIVSTANVPPQQMSWAKDLDVSEEVKSQLMTLDEAKAYRLELMEERTMLNDTVEGSYDTYNLCEH